MGAFIVATLSVACFAIVLVRSQIVGVAREVSRTSVTGVTAMFDRTLDDDAKERAVQQAGLGLLKLSWGLLWRIALCLVAAFVPVLGANLAGWVPQEDSLTALMRVDFLVVVTVVAMAVSFVIGKRTAPNDPTVNDASSYGSGDRLIHTLAFAGPRVQKGLARFDDRLFARRIAQTSDAPPIFITSLARGGTTALLNALHDLPDVATHRYADMPFICAPLLWSRLAGKRDNVVERERSHGDGLKIGLQSPEAFDEIFWMLHWPEKYRAGAIDLWTEGDAKTEASAFFQKHFAKIAHLRRPGAAAPVRYLSKNNANIARLPLLPAMFPGCQIVVPLREPSAHAASLFRQHKNFLKLHAEDAFAARYMADIGHFEFGNLHRPMAFNLDVLGERDLNDPNYWLRYWISCFEGVEPHLPSIHLIKQDNLRSAPQATMEALLDKVGLAQAPSKNWESYFRTEADALKDDMFDAGLLAEARTLYHRLGDQAS